VTVPVALRIGEGETYMGAKRGGVDARRYGFALASVNTGARGVLIYSGTPKPIDEEAIHNPEKKRGMICIGN
jgi:hypothetical protein